MHLDESNSPLVTSRRRLHAGRFNWNAAEIVALGQVVHRLASDQPESRAARHTADGIVVFLSSEEVASRASDEFRGGAAPDASGELFAEWIRRGAARPVDDDQRAAIDADSAAHRARGSLTRSSWVQIIPRGFRKLYPDEAWFTR